MADRKPLVIANGQIQQLQESDRLLGVESLRWLLEECLVELARIRRPRSAPAADISLLDSVLVRTPGEEARKAGVDRMLGFSDPAAICDFRLSTESGIAVTTSLIQSAQGTLYAVPYQDLTSVDASGLGRLALHDGTRWKLHATAEFSLPLTISNGSNYDVFAYDNAGTVAMELSAAWASNTARTDALAMRDGVLVKSMAATRRYLGTIRASGTNVTEDTETKRFVWSYYHRVSRKLYKEDGTFDSYNGGYRQWRGDSTNQVDFVLGVPLSYWGAVVAEMEVTTAGVHAVGGIQRNATSSVDAYCFVNQIERFAVGTSFPYAHATPGYHFLAAIQSTQNTGTSSFHLVRFGAIIEG